MKRVLSLLGIFLLLLVGCQSSGPRNSTGGGTNDVPKEPLKLSGMASPPLPATRSALPRQSFGAIAPKAGPPQVTLSWTWVDPTDVDGCIIHGTTDPSLAMTNWPVIAATTGLVESVTIPLDIQAQSWFFAARATNILMGIESDAFSNIVWPAPGANLRIQR